MKPTGRAVLHALCACGFLSLANSAHAQAIRYISTTGNDASTCILTAPCRNLQRGINATPAGGELRVLDSGGYGAQGTITKSMAINGQGNTLLMGGSPAIRVNDASAVVVLSGLHLNGRNTLGLGVQVDAAAVVHVLGCKVERFTDSGILLNGSNTEYHVAGTISSDNATAGLSVGNGATTLTVDNSIFENNSLYGLVADTNASITNSIASGNGSVGVLVAGGRSNVVWTTAANNGTGFYLAGSTGGEMNLEFSTARGNLFGVYVGDTSIGRISNSTVTDNGTGIEIDPGGTVETRENNTVAGNGTDINGSGLVPLPPT